MWAHSSFRRGSTLGGRTIRAEAARPEAVRIAFLLQRDGPEATRAWVERTLQIYETALSHAHSHASDPVYRPLFERAVDEMREWLSRGAPVEHGA